MAPLKPQRDDDAQSAGRFNVLLAEESGRASDEWTQHFSRLMEPQGVRAIVAHSGREALEISAEIPIHAAVVDLTTPRESARSADTGSTAPGGLWLLEVLNRRRQRPPVVMLNGRTYSAREAQRILNQALRLGAFSVLNRPVDLERLLHVIRRLIEREYQGTWPGSVTPPQTHEAENPPPGQPRHATGFRFQIRMTRRYSQKPPNPQNPKNKPDT